MKSLFSKVTLKHIVKTLKYGLLYNSINDDDAIFLYNNGVVYKGKGESESRIK